MNINDFRNKKKIFFSYYPGDVDTILSIINHIYEKNDLILFNKFMYKLVIDDQSYNKIISKKKIEIIKKNINFFLKFLCSLLRTEILFVSDINSRYFFLFLNFLSLFFNFKIIIFKHTSTPYAPFDIKPKNFFLNFYYILAFESEIYHYTNQYKLKNIIKFNTGVLNTNYLNIIKKNFFFKKFNYCLIYSYSVHEIIYSYKDKLLDLENIILALRTKYNKKIKIIIKKHPQEKDNVIEILQKKYKNYVLLSNANSINLSLNCHLAIGIGTTGGLFTAFLLKKKVLNYYTKYNSYYNYLSSKNIKYCIIEKNIATAKKLTSLKYFINNAKNL